MPTTDPNHAVVALMDLADGHRAEAARLDAIVETFCTCNHDADIDEGRGCGCGDDLDPEEWEEVGYTTDGPGTGSIFVAPTDPAPRPVDLTPLLGARIPFKFGPSAAEALAAYEKPWRDKLYRRAEQLRPAVEEAVRMSRAAVLAGLDGDRPAADFDEEEDASRVIDVEPGLTADREKAVEEFLAFGAGNGVKIPADDYVPAPPAWEYGTVAPCGTGPRIAARRRGNLVEFTDSTELDDVRWMRPGLSSTVQSFRAFE